MNPIKVGEFIKKIRKDNNLTQKDLANKYGVTFQAVSKWENGINLPEVSLLREMSKDFNISIEDLLDGEIKIKGKNNKKILIIVLITLVVSLVVGLSIFIVKKNSNFNLKNITSACTEFNVTGSIAYNNDKSSISIQKIDYCGSEYKGVYKRIDCTLYEKNGNSYTKVASCTPKEETSLNDFLDGLTISINGYSKTCKKYEDDSLFIEVTVTDDSDRASSHKIPLNLNDNCSNK